MLAYLTQLGIAPTLVNHAFLANADSLIFQLATPPEDPSTVDLRFRPEMEINDQLISLPSRHGNPTTVLTVSEKEIVLSLMQHGRLTEFSGNQCSFQVFRDHVGIHQNIVVWAENVEWSWPDENLVQWNKRYWKKGKLLEMRYNIPARNFVPGDWGYLLNADLITAKKIGYEGSNATYLGRGKFDDYYNDHNHSYLFRKNSMKFTNGATKSLVVGATWPKFTH